MVKKLALAPLFFSANVNDVATTLSSSSSTSRCSTTYSMSAAASSSWQWPSCAQQPRTLSFAASRDHDMTMSASASTRHQQLEYYKTSVMNPAYGSCFLGSPDDDHCSSTTSSAASSCVEGMSTSVPEPEPEPAAAEVIDDVLIRGIRSSTRLFFEPEPTSSIVKPAAAPFGGGTAMAIDSSDPYGDFRRSMEEMVLSHGGASSDDDWGWLEEMLGWYLSANGRKTHGLIVGAFVDLLVALSSSSSSSSSCSFVKLAADQ